MNRDKFTLEIIDLTLGMKRLNTTEKINAIEALTILFETLKTDVATLQAAEEKNEWKAAEAVLCRIDSGLNYSGTPRLEQACELLYDMVKRTHDLRKLSFLFGLFYDEVTLFNDAYQALIKLSNL